MMKTAATLLALASLAPLAHASEPTAEQQHISDVISNTHIIGAEKLAEATEAKADSMRRLMAAFYTDQYRHFQDPLSPYFLFMSKDATLAMGMGGCVRMRGWGDFGGSIPANGFIPFLIPAPSNPEQRRDIGATPAGTTLMFRVIGRNRTMGNYQLGIEANFNGYEGLGFKLKKAYAMWNDWTVGYTTTTFADPMAQPPTIDGAGPNGLVSRSSVLIRWFHTIKNNWVVGAGAEIADANIEADASCKGLNTWLPDVVALGQYQWDDARQHVRVALIGRNLSYRNLLTAKNHNVMGYGAQISAVVMPTHKLTLYGIANAGRGIGSYVNDLSIGNYDLQIDTTDPGHMSAPTSYGLTLGSRYDILPNCYSCIALGATRYHSDLELPGSAYKYGLYGAVNVFYNFTPRIQVGAEYLAGRRGNFDGTHGSANRICLLLQCSF